MTDILLNDTPIQAHAYSEEIVHDPKTSNPLHTIRFHFYVKSEDYHAITTLLYKAVFDVTVVQSGLRFRGEIRNYSTSVTNLYKENQVGEFVVELIETPSMG